MATHFEIESAEGNNNNNNSNNNKTTKQQQQQQQQNNNRQKDPLTAQECEKWPAWAVAARCYCSCWPRRARRFRCSSGPTTPHSGGLQLFSGTQSMGRRWQS
ncbi:unnamed protein product [Polarella glacialis]|uniref:Uncharacterized protein n=1 Tax=Polarella glacialis TaxID=89957 RepID=A0A813I5R4_POLGL|nr:unnamed protein product [Polarella glacialis]